MMCSLYDCVFMVGYLSCACFFVKQKTAYEMRISDWSSDVCSSDLPSRVLRQTRRWARFRGNGEERRNGGTGRQAGRQGRGRERWCAQHRSEIGRASCRERVCQYV